MNNIEDFTEEMKERYILRTRAHLYLVRKWSDKIVSYNHSEIDTNLLNEERDVHDQTKFNSPEMIPYIWITWNYYMKRKGENFELSEDIKNQTHRATFHHIKNNKHHPEYWDNKVTIDKLNKEDRDKPSGEIVDGTKMPLTYIAAMCADWFAMSEELGTNPKIWADNNINTRWKFSKKQVDLIYELIEKVY